MSILRTGSLPDLVEGPSADARGTVVVLGGIGETSADFGLLTEQLVLDGFRVELFDDVSVDPDASSLGALQALEGGTAGGPQVVIGSDVGATIAAGIAAGRSAPVTALVLADLVTGASRRAGEGGQRLPAGVRLPPARDVGVPTVVFHGDADAVTDVADAVSWATQLPAGAVRLVPRGDHGVLTGASRRTVAASIVLFLERQRAGEPVLSDGFA